MTPRSNIYEDAEGVWIVLDPQNREEWEAFWQSLLLQVEEDDVSVISGDRVQVKFNGATTPKLGNVELADRPDGLVSVRMDNGEVWTVGKDELLPPDAPLEPIAYELTGDNPE